MGMCECDACVNDVLCLCCSVGGNDCGDTLVHLLMAVVYVSVCVCLVLKEECVVFVSNTSFT